MSGGASDGSDSASSTRPVDLLVASAQADVGADAALADRAARIAGGRDSASSRGSLTTSRSGDRPALVSEQRATKSSALPVMKQSVSGRVTRTVAPTDPRDIALGMLSNYGWSGNEFGCLDSLYIHESGWDHTATNPSSGAYGIPQSLPADKMASAGADWRTNPQTQLQWGLSYIRDRYGSPCGAWGFWQANNWY